jgi:arylamine N-acetyltransferase
MGARLTPEPVLPQSLVERVLSRLGLPGRPSIDLAGLNRVYAAVSGKIGLDNIQKRIWLAGKRDTPITGGEPEQFFENWLDHGTAGTCFPINGGVCSLLQALDFDARRIGGSVDSGGNDIDGNHGSVVVRIGGTDYLTDGSISSFKPLPLIPGQISSTGNGIHDIRAEPDADRFQIIFNPRPNRDEPLVFYTEPKYDPVDHQFFLRNYDLSVSSEDQRSRFNEALFVSRRYPDSILIVGRLNKFVISADNSVAKTEITVDQRTQILIDDLGISEEIAHAIPPDNEGQFSMT